MKTLRQQGLKVGAKPLDEFSLDALVDADSLFFRRLFHKTKPCRRAAIRYEILTASVPAMLKLDAECEATQ